MLARVRRHISYTNLALTVALVFAMSGGAFAASRYTITSTRQISPKVLKRLTGKAGPQGAQGIPGVKGEPGVAGATGAVGPAGAKGEQGLQGEKGAAGEPGKEGSPWTVGGVLPEDQTETGSWNAIGTVTLPENGKLQESEQEVRGLPISFTLPVQAAVKPVFLKLGEGNTAECPGTVAKPEAKPGFLCVYATAEAGINTSTIGFIAAGQVEEGASPTGTIMRVTVTGETGTTSFAWGTWAVTAA